MLVFVLVMEIPVIQRQAYHFHFGDPFIFFFVGVELDSIEAVRKLLGDKLNFQQ